MASDKFLSFRTFKDQAYAKDFTAVLEGLDIPYEIESSGLLNPLEMNSDREYYIKVKGVDFVRANGAIRAFYAEQVQHAEADYYLFSFSEEELQDLLAHPDEWSDFDYALATKILKDKGIDPEEKSKTIATENPAHLKAKEDAPRFSQQNLVSGIVQSFFGGYIGIWKGWHVLNDKKILPNGEEDYLYPEPDRKRAGLLFAVGGAILFGYILVFIILLYKKS